MSAPTGSETFRAGWYDDPGGRFELRYHNGERWTADVALAGHRYVDPLPSGDTDPASHPSTPPAHGFRGYATTSLVVGIVALTVAWLPYVFAAGIVLAGIALSFAIIALRRARAAGRSSGNAIAGLVTGSVALALAPLGFWLTTSLASALDDHRNPARHRVDVACTTDGDNAWTATGSLTNLGATTASFSVEVWFSRSGLDRPTRRTIVEIDDLPPGESAPIDVTRTLSLPAVDCSARVAGPLPWGLDLWDP